MSIQHLLEDFRIGRGGSHALALQDEEETETKRLAAFEEGYQAGWDDATTAHSNNKLRITSDLAQNLLDMSFTYNEAYSHLLKGLRPLLSQMVEKLLPEVMHDTVGHRIVDEVHRMAAANMKGEALIRVSPVNLASVEALLERDQALPATVESDPSLAEGQAQISLPDNEIEINLDDVISEIRTALEAFNHDLQKETQDGRKQAV